MPIRDITTELAALTDRLHLYRLWRQRHMTPKLQGALQALKMLQHNVEADADEMVARVAELDARRRVAKDKTSATLNAAGASLGDIEEFVAALEGNNGAPNLEAESPAPSEEAKQAKPPYSW